MDSEPPCAQGWSSLPSLPTAPRGADWLAGGSSEAGRVAAPPKTLPGLESWLQELHPHCLTPPHCSPSLPQPFRP